MATDKTTIINDFHQLWTDSGKGTTWHTCKYRGVKALKCPLDLFMYHELIYKHKPNLIIETGTCFGGSALYLADQCQLLKHGKVITIDVRPPHNSISHPRLEVFTGSSVAASTFNYVSKQARNKKVMVILDSDHSTPHVLEELKLYSQLANTYLIVEDTNMGHEARRHVKSGPREAVHKFLASPAGKNFKIDKGCEKYLMTFNPDGYLKWTPT